MNNKVLVHKCIKAFRLSGFAMNNPVYIFGTSKSNAVRNHNARIPKRISFLKVKNHDLSLVNNPSLSPREKDEVINLGKLC